MGSIVQGEHEFKLPGRTYPGPLRKAVQALDVGKYHIHPGPLKNASACARVARKATGKIFRCRTVDGEIRIYRTA